MRAMTEWLAGARGWVAVAVLAAGLAGPLVAATLIPGSLGGTATGSASLLPDRTASSAGARTGTPAPGREPATVLKNITPGGRGVTTTRTPTVRSCLTDAVPRER